VLLLCTPTSAYSYAASLSTSLGSIDTTHKNCTKIAQKLHRNCTEIAHKLHTNSTEIAQTLHRICTKIAQKFAQKLHTNCACYSATRTKYEAQNMLLSYAHQIWTQNMYAAQLRAPNMHAAQLRAPNMKHSLLTTYLTTRRFFYWVIWTRLQCLYDARIADQILLRSGCLCVLCRRVPFSRKLQMLMPFSAAGVRAQCICSWLFICCVRVHICVYVRVNVRVCVWACWCLCTCLGYAEECHSKLDEVKL
jgi:hypothetical protein